MHFIDTNAVIQKKTKISPKMCLYLLKNNPNGEFFSNFLQVSKFVLH